MDRFIKNSCRIAVAIIWVTQNLVFAAKPAITTEPVGQIVSVGQPVSFSVIASGTDPLTYQWQFNGTDISAATNTSFIIVAASMSDAGAYTVAVANHSGSVISSNAVLNVGYPPSIVQQPVSQAVTPGSNAVFELLVNGTLPISYRWRFNGAEISEATNTALAMANLQAAQAGVYTVVASNAYGSITSSPTTLTIVDQTIVIDFESLPPVGGFSLVSAGQYYREKGFVLSPLTLANTFAYWQTNSPNYPGSTAMFLNSEGNYTSLARGDAGFFDLVSIDLCPIVQGETSVVTLVGYNALQQVVTYQASLDANIVLKTFSLPAFTNLTEVRWQNVSMTHNQFDNITVIAKPGDVLPPLIQIGDSSQFNSTIPFYLTRLRVQTDYTLQKSSDLVNWKPFFSFTATTTSRSGRYDFFDPTARSMFYRLQAVQ